MPRLSFGLQFPIRQHPLHRAAGEAGIEPSVGSKATATTTHWPRPSTVCTKAKVIHRRTAWKAKEWLELATLQRVGWFNNQRLMDRWATCRRPSSRPTTIDFLSSRPCRPDSSKPASVIPGAVHLASIEHCRQHVTSASLALLGGQFSRWAESRGYARASHRHGGATGFPAARTMVPAFSPPTGPVHKSTWAPRRRC